MASVRKSASALATAQHAVEIARKDESTAFDAASGN
jgi:hypothetical protein